MLKTYKPQGKKMKIRNITNQIQLGFKANVLNTIVSKALCIRDVPAIR